jgi:transposase
VLSGRRYRVDFASDQATFAETIGATCRSVWNTALEQRRLYGARGSWISYREQARQLADAKAAFPWLAQPPSHTLQQTLMDLDKACTTHGTRNARWRSARSWSPSFRFPDPAQITVQCHADVNAAVNILTAGRAELGHETRERELGRANPDNRGRKAQRQPTAARRFSPTGLVEIPRCVPGEDVNRG